MDNTQMLFTTILNEIEKTQAVVGNLEHDSNAHYAELLAQLAMLRNALDHVAGQLAVLNKTIFIGNGLSHQSRLTDHTGRIGAIETWKKGIQDRFWKVVFAGMLPLIAIIGAVAVALYKIDAMSQVIKRLFTSSL